MNYKRPPDSVLVRKLKTAAENFVPKLNEISCMQFILQDYGVNIKWLMLNA